MRQSQQQSQDFSKKRAYTQKEKDSLVFLHHSSHPTYKEDSSFRSNAHQFDQNPEKIISKSTEYQKEYAKYLELIPQEVIQNPKLWAFIDDWWGTPYRLGGASKRGIDCSAFSQKLYKEVFQIHSIPRTARAQYKASIKIKHIRDLQPGDLVFFKIHSRRISHVGIYLQNNKFVDATVSSGVTISDLTNPYWQRYFVGGGRPKELETNTLFLATKDQ